MGILAASLLPEAKSGQMWGPFDWSADPFGPHFSRVGPAVGEDVTSFMGRLAQSREESARRLWAASEAATSTSFPFFVRCDHRGPFAMWEKALHM